MIAQSEPISAYVHVPFCLSRCIYCDFYVTLEKYGGQAAYVDALCREIAARLGCGPARSLRTLYVGGGTPSLLGADAYARILDAFRRVAHFTPDAEMTIEANPGAMRSAPETYRALGFNRISVGIQSLQDGELKRLSRAHSASEAAAFIRRLQQAGWDNISIDLMYGIPGQTQASWQQTLDATAALGVAHVSMYGLKVEAGTALATLQARGIPAYDVPDDDETVAMYFQAVDFWEARGLALYEFSNLARAGMASQHNLNYWDNGDYYAFGPSAHGYVENVRSENARDLAAWIENPLAGTAQPCPPRERLENAIIFGLRKTRGIHLPSIERAHGIDFTARYGHVIEKYAEFFERKGGNLALRRTAIPLSNTILAEFLDNA